MIITLDVKHSVGTEFYYENRWGKYTSGTINEIVFADIRHNSCKKTRCNTFYLLSNQEEIYYDHESGIFWQSCIKGVNRLMLIAGWALSMKEISMTEIIPKESKEASWEILTKFNHDPVYVKDEIPAEIERINVKIYESCTKIYCIYYSIKYRNKYYDRKFAECLMETSRVFKKDVNELIENLSHEEKESLKEFLHKEVCEDELYLI